MLRDSVYTCIFIRKSGDKVCVVQYRKTTVIDEKPKQSPIPRVLKAEFSLAEARSMNVLELLEEAEKRFSSCSDYQNPFI